MGFIQFPLSVIPEIGITDKGLVLVPEMKQVDLLEPGVSSGGSSYVPCGARR